MNREVVFKDLGLITYMEAWDLQESTHAKIVKIKVESRNCAADSSRPFVMPTANFLFFCEHPHVYTLGKSGKETHLLINDDQLKKMMPNIFTSTAEETLPTMVQGSWWVTPFSILKFFSRTFISICAILKRQSLEHCVNTISKAEEFRD